MRYAVPGPSFASFVRELFASIVKMTEKSIWLLFVLVILAFFVTIETYPSNEFEGGNDEYSGKIKVYDLKAKAKKRSLENALITDENDAETAKIINAEPNQWKHKVVRAQSRPRRLHTERHDPWNLVAEDGTMEDKADERYDGRWKRNATQLKSSKKGQKKLKLALSKLGSKTKLGKTRSSFLNNAESSVDRTEKKVHRRHVDYSMRDMPGRFRSKRYAVSRTFGDNRADYYAQRKAVMERFYARQREISEKYARKTSTSAPTYIQRYDITGNENEKNGSASSNGSDTRNVAKVDNAVDSNNTNNNNNNYLDIATQAPPTTEAYKEPMKTTTTANRQNLSNKVQIPYHSLEENNEEDGSDDYDYYILEDNKWKSTPEPTSEDVDILDDGDVEVMYEEIKDPLKWGICNGRLVYQHNLIINVHNSARADADISTSLEGPFCVTCFRVTPASRNNATATLIVGSKLDGTLLSARIQIKSFQEQTLVYTLKVWAVSMLHMACSRD